MKRKYVLGILTFAMVGLLSVGLVSAYRSGGKFSLGDRDALREAIENDDFEAWRSLKQEKISRMLGEIDEEKFEEMRARHQERDEFRNQMQQARESGDGEKLQELRSQFAEGKGIRKRNTNFNNCPFAK